MESSSRMTLGIPTVLSPEVLKNTFDWVTNELVIAISDDDKEIVYQCRRTFFVSDSDIWYKKQNAEFDNNIGYFDGC